VHIISGRWKLGFSLAVVTALFWGVLPVAMTVVLRVIDPVTLTWFRFLTASLMLGGVLALLRQLPNLRTIGGKGWFVLGLAVLGLSGNFVIYVIALGYASPTINQVVTQLSPILLMLGGIAVFHERFSVIRWTGFALLLVGLPLFFNHRLPELLHFRSGLGLGVLLLVICSIIWAVYGLAQKWMLRKLQAQQILLILYVVSTLVLMPAAHPTQIVHVDALQGWLLAFCCANTVVAYGAFAEALKHWEASRVGATLTLTPLFTMATMWVLEHSLPGFVKPEQLNFASVVGALVVVGGSMLCALGASGAARKPQSDTSTATAVLQPPGD
jgi:drug/metabolite transporter (DMT)-like permease